MIVNPVQPAANWFLALFSVIPSPIKLLVALSVGIFVITCIIKMVRL